MRGLLTNPVYGGAYAFGRTASRVTVENGRKHVSRGHRRDREDWDVLIVDHHEGYVSWEEFERNQRLIADNANCRGLMVRGAVRRGDALLAGLMRCGHCGRRLHVTYSGTDGFCVRYACRGAQINHGTAPCISFGGMRVDAAVAAEALRLLAPLGIEAALAAVAQRAEGRRRDATAGGARADPGALRGGPGTPPVRCGGPGDAARRRRARAPLERSAHRGPAPRGAAGRHRRGGSRPCPPPRRIGCWRSAPISRRLWAHPGATAETRKRILRTVLEEIVCTLAEDRIELLLHWRGGDHTRLTVARNRTGSIAGAAMLRCVI